MALAVIKFSSLILTGVFGAYGLLVKFKDENGEITKAGRNALVLILMSTVTSGLSAAFELYRDSVRERTALEAQSKETLETAKRTELLLSGINRSLQPISTLIVSHWINVPMDHVGLKPYITRFESELPRALALLSAGRFVGYRGGSFDEARNPIDIEFDGSAVLAPNKSSEELAFMVLGYCEVSLEFFKSPIDPALHYLVNDRSGKSPDLRIELRSGLGIPGAGGNHNIEYSLKNKTFKLSGFDLSSDSKFWRSTGKIISIPDLAGSQLFIAFPSVMQSGDIEVD